MSTAHAELTHVDDVFMSRGHAGVNSTKPPETKTAVADIRSGFMTSVRPFIQPDQQSQSFPSSL